VADYACPAEFSGIPDRGRHDRPPTRGPLLVERRAVGAIAPAAWDGLARLNPWATPFSAWAFQRAWWDAYGANARDETLVVTNPAAPSGDPPLAILPLMHRHEVEPDDVLTHTQLRHGAEIDLTPVPATARAAFFGASYHADYATILTAPADLPEVARAVVAHLAGDPNTGVDDPLRWDVADFRRLRCGDPAADELAAAFGIREMELGWTLNIEREDVCPVTQLPEGSDFEGFVATLGGKERHEVKRKIRRAEAGGEVRLEASRDPLIDLEAFIDLHQRRWGDAGLFPATIGGDQSRTFLRRLFELSGPDGAVRLAFLTVGGRRIGAGIHFETADSFLYYNAGVDPDARELSPGILMVARYIDWAIAVGKRRFDFLRGSEAYKYEWGAIDEPIRRLLVRRTGPGQ